MNVRGALVGLIFLCSAAQSNAQIRLSRPDDWVTQVDIADLGLNKGRLTWLVVELEISGTGGPTACKARVTPPDATIGKKLCALVLKRARYEPAQDRAGRPVSTKDRVGYVIWKGDLSIYTDFGGARIISGSIFDQDYPPGAEAQHQSGDVVTRFKIDEIGNLVDCKVVLSSNSPALDRQTCALMTKRFKFQPPVGKLGMPAATTGQFRIFWRSP